MSAPGRGGLMVRAWLPAPVGWRRESRNRLVRERDGAVAGLWVRPRREVDEDWTTADSVSANVNGLSMLLGPLQVDPDPRRAWFAGCPGHAMEFFFLKEAEDGSERRMAGYAVSLEVGETTVNLHLLVPVDVTGQVAWRHEAAIFDTLWLEVSEDRPLEHWREVVRWILDDMGDEVIRLAEMTGGGAEGHGMRRASRQAVIRALGPLEEARSKEQAILALEEGCGFGPCLVTRARAWLRRLLASGDDPPPSSRRPQDRWEMAYDDTGRQAFELEGES